jgi:hypothetical protein
MDLDIPTRYLGACVVLSRTYFYDQKAADAGSELFYRLKHQFRHKTFHSGKIDVLQNMNRDLDEQISETVFEDDRSGKIIPMEAGELEAAFVG